MANFHPRWTVSIWCHTPMDNRTGFSYSTGCRSPWLAIAKGIAAWRVTFGKPYYAGYVIDSIRLIDNHAEDMRQFWEACDKFGAIGRASYERDRTPDWFKHGVDA